MASKRGSGSDSGRSPRRGAKRQRQHGKSPPYGGQSTKPSSSSSLPRHPDPAAPPMRQPHPPLHPDQQVATSRNSSGLPPLPLVFHALFDAIIEKAASCFTPPTVAWLQDKQYIKFLPPVRIHDQYPPSPDQVTVDSQQIIRLAEAFGSAVAICPERNPPKASDGHLIGMLHRISTTMLDAVLKATTLHMVDNPDYLLPSTVWQEFMISYSSSNSSGPSTSHPAPLITGINRGRNFGDSFPKAELKMCLRNLRQDRSPRLAVSADVLRKWRRDRDDKPRVPDQQHH